MTGNRRGESALIEHYFAPLCDPDASFGLSDDTAFVSVPADRQLVVTKDMLVADIHFLSGDAPDLVARKALRVNLSDLAAKGAKPLGYLLGLGLPADWTENWLASFCEGLKADQSTYRFPLLGGDTVKSPERLTLSVTAFGTIDADRWILRRNARPGDGIYVTGTIGDGALGLLAHKGKLAGLVDDAHIAFLQNRYLMPQPRLEAAHLIRQYASASMDISDGLLGDAAKMAKAASVEMRLMKEAVPLSPAAGACLAQNGDVWSTILSGGDDYELLFSVPSDREEEMMQKARQAKLAISYIGRVAEGQGVVLSGEDGRPLAGIFEGAYEHF